jgi:stage II sporulation protein D
VIIQSRTGELSISNSQHDRNGVSGARSHGWSVSGVLEIFNQGTTLLAVNRVDLEAYVAGVVSSEISPNWHSEALKTQAVAARTYVLNKKITALEQKFDVVASVQDQVYTGRSLVNQAIRKAIRETSGMVVTYEKRPIFAAYSSTAAGPTEDAMNVWDADLPYLKGVDCPFDEESPRFEWEATVGLRDLEDHLRKAGYAVGTIATFIPLSFTRAGRVNDIRMLHSKGELILRGQDFRKAVGYSVIPSTQFSIAGIGREVIFSGRGAGHGVGMCQWGAKEMAELGYRYESILQYYYPGTQLLPLRQVDLSPPELVE